MSAFVAWEGLSPIDGAELVLIVTGPSGNTKTGPMYQAWLLLRNLSPFDALRQGADRALCGDCVHRSGSRRTCYVSMFNGPIGIWRKFILGFYPKLAPAAAARALRGQSVRITAYGDPAFVPFEIWQSLLAEASGWVGYTHQWRGCDRRFQGLLMASVESEREARAAQARGWRTFRARSAGALLLASEFQCPASDEGGHRATCLDCQLCRGSASPAKSVSIWLHGKGAAARRGPRVKYNGLRDQLRTFGKGELACAPADRARVMLALKQYYRRRHEPVRLSSKQVGEGVYRFSLQPATAMELGA